MVFTAAAAGRASAAFTLGMRAVNPQAQVKVIRLDTWFDPARERDAALASCARATTPAAIATRRAR